MALLVMMPLLIFFVDYPQLFWERSGDVSFKVDWSSSTGLTAFAQHLLSAGRVFVDGYDPNWRHHLQGQSVFDGVSIFGFLIGTVITLKQYRHPRNLFLLSSLFVMWLPAVLSDPAFHTLRLVGILPTYYVMVAVGLLSVIKWVKLQIPSQFANRPTGAIKYPPGMIGLGLVLLVSGSLTYYNYFHRWATLPEVYQAFDGQVVSLAQNIVNSDDVNVVIPFYLYTHASMRYLLDSQFEEMVLTSETSLTEFDQQQEIAVIIPTYPPDDEKPPAFVWLRKNKANTGVAYVSTVVRDQNVLTLNPKVASLVEDEQGNVIAYQHPVKWQKLSPLFQQNLPQKKTFAMWANNLVLSGYEFVPSRIEAGEISALFLSWDVLGYTGLQAKMFLQLLDSQGNAVGQAELEALSRKMYRWRKDGLILEQYPLKFDTNLSPGLYFARLGFFDPDTGQRLSAYNPNNQLLGDTIIVGPVYLGTDDINPTQPQYPVEAMLGDKIELLGYSIYPVESENTTHVELYWKTHAPIEIDYTVFLQMLDQQNGVVAQVDAQPLLNIYPTSHWQPGDIISDRFVLPIPSSELSADNKLVTGMYNLSTGVRLSAYNYADELLPGGLIHLID